MENADRERKIEDITIAEGKLAKFFTGDEYPVLVVHEGGDRYVVLDTPAKVRDYEKNINHEAWEYADRDEEVPDYLARDWYREYVDAVADWFRMKTGIGFELIDSIGFQSLYFNDMFKGQKFKEKPMVRVDEKGHIRLLTIKIDDGLLFKAHFGGEMPRVEQEIWGARERKKEHRDFMMALNTIRAFIDEGRFPPDINAPPLSKDTVRKLSKAMGLGNKVDEKKLRRYLENGEWLKHIETTDEIYAVANILKKRVAEVILNSYAVKEDGFLDVWRSFEVMITRETGAKKILEDIERSMERRAEHKEISIGV